jgi:hypothetical protein
MTRRSFPARGMVGFLAVALLAGLIAIPVLAASPSGAPTAATSTATPTPTKAPKPQKSPKPDRGPKADRAPETAVTVKGTVGTRTDANGRTEYTLTTGSTVRVLDAGPPWFYGSKHPLKPYVGKQVTIAGGQRAGEDELEVTSVDGTAIREPGKPPWAGGWKVVGKDHPGWTQEKWDRWQTKLKARGTSCWPPGQCKDKPTGTHDPADD